MVKSDDKALQAANYLLLHVILELVEEDGLTLEDVAERYFDAELRVENDRVIITPEGDPPEVDFRIITGWQGREVPAMVFSMDGHVMTQIEVEGIIEHAIRQKLDLL